MKTAEKIPRQASGSSLLLPSWVRLGCPKIRPTHLERLPSLYLRQSSPQQVRENRESTARQYALADLAVGLGWPRERVMIVDEDLGKSGRTVEGRSGFQRLIREVTLGHIGIVFGLEMSRLARSSKDWHNFFEMCALFDTLIADEDGVYDGHEPNDRMLLGLKGIISEMELHTMRSRLNQGLLNKARRGELFLQAPIGYVRSADKMELDPDEQVQSVVRLIFEKFAELQSAAALLKYLVAHGIRVGVRRRNGRVPSAVTWCRPVHGTLLQMLHNPVYAGAYCLGRRTSDPRRRGPHRRRRVELPMEEWKVLLKDMLPAYITWQQFLANQEQLKANHVWMTGRGPTKNGRALLGGLLKCGLCGARMSVHYKQNDQFRYACLRHAIAYGEKPCQDVKGNPLDDLIAEKVLRALEPAALELSLSAASEVEKEREHLHRNWQQRVERGRYETERAARQYEATEPENRLVARELEKRWETALKEQKRLEEEYDHFCAEQPRALTSEDRELLRGQSAAIPKLWNMPSTTAKDRKTIVRHLVDHVVVKEQGRSEYVDVTIYWAGGFVSAHEILQPIHAFKLLRDGDTP